MKTCTIEGCMRKCHAKGKCKYHYNKYRYQTPEHKARKAARMKKYNARPEVIEHRRAWTREYRNRPEVKMKMKIARRRYALKRCANPEFKKKYLEKCRKYNAQPENRERRCARVNFRNAEKEYQKLVVLYGEANGDIPRRLILRLEALSDYFGRDLEEWRLGKDKERHLEMLEKSGDKIVAKKCKRVY